MLYDCTLNEHEVVGHLDPGATDCFIYPNEAKRLNLPVVRSVHEVELGDGSVRVIRPRQQKRSQERVTFKRISIKTMVKIVRKKKAELFAIRVIPSMKDMHVSDDYKDLVLEYQDIFKGELPDTLPPRREVDFEIHLKADEPAPVRPVIRLSPDELAELRRQLQMLLQKKLIRPSSSPYGAPVFFVKKKEGDLRMVCDYRALNKITVPDSNPVPLISEAIDQVSGATIFSKIDLLGAYHQMRLREEEIPKTAIRTRYGSFEWRVLCFGLMNAPASVTRLLSTLLRDLHGDGLVLFLDDVLVYSRTKEEHAAHLRRLFDILRKNKLYAKRSKCHIGMDEVDFLGYSISARGITMQDRLKRAMLEWPTPNSLKEIQQFVGLANYYRKFIRGFAKILRPVTDLLRKHTFSWGDEQQNAFDQLKTTLTTAPVLAHPSSEKEFFVSTDASKFAVGATLEQDGKPVGYLSHRLSDAETNWDTGDQELLAFMISLRHWDIYLRGRNFTFRTDHEPIRYLQSKARLSGRQARWLDVLQSYTYDTEHITGAKHSAQ